MSCRLTEGLSRAWEHRHCDAVHPRHLHKGLSEVYTFLLAVVPSRIARCRFVRVIPVLVSPGHRTCVVLCWRKPPSRTRLRGDPGLPAGQSAHVDPLDILDCNGATLLGRRMVIDLTKSNASLSTVTRGQRPLPSAPEETDYLCAPIMTIAPSRLPATSSTSPGCCPRADACSRQRDTSNALSWHAPLADGGMGVVPAQRPTALLRTLGGGGPVAIAPRVRIEPITDEGVAVGGAFDSDTAVGMMPIAHSRRRCASVLAIVTRRQEVRPMNAVSAMGAPLQSTIARLR